MLRFTHAEPDRSYKRQFICDTITSDNMYNGGIINWSAIVLLILSHFGSHPCIYAWCSWWWTAAEWPAFLSLAKGSIWEDQLYVYISVLPGQWVRARATMQRYKDCRLSVVIVLFDCLRNMLKFDNFWWGACPQTAPHPYYAVCYAHS